MALNNQATPTNSYNVVFDAALKEYKEKTKQSLEGHTLLTQLEICDSPTAVVNILEGQVNANANEGLKKWLNPMINVLYAFSATLGEMFPPTKMIFAGVGVLLSVVKDLNADQDALIGVFEQIGFFFRRLKVYTEVPPTPMMKETMVKIMVEVLNILAIATKESKRSRAKKFLKKLAGRTDMMDALKRLDELTKEEALMSSARLLENTHAISDKLTGVSNDIDDVKRSQIRENLRKWLSPPDPSMNHNIACRRQYGGTAEWFFRRDTFKKWKVIESLLWIHGKPGSGKSVLCSAIIENISILCEGGLASMAYFYFDFRDVDKQSLSKLLPSLLVQLSTHSDPRRDILSHLYEAHGNGARRPKDGALTQCLKEMLTLPDQGPVYLILDALDECSDISVPSARKRVLDFVKDLVGLRLPNLHICVTSRPEVDITDVIESLTFHPVSLHDESGQKEDIAKYVRSVVYSDSGAAMSRWRVEEKELVIKTLTDKADGMFRWVYCQLAVLRKCLRQSLRQTLSKLPETLDSTYERILEEIGRPNGDPARRILQCLAVASRPLHVEELAEILALDFKEAKGRLPEFNEDWRSEDRQQDLLITCSSLITIVNDRGSRKVQFSHFSVKEFLMSDRLATPVRNISAFHILPKSAHTILAQACLAVLLHLDDSHSKKWIRSNFPLAGYAAQHWVDHAQFEGVSLRVKEGMQQLFDQSRPCFTAWHKLHDIDLWYPITAQPHATPLYYASLCGFHDLAEHLIATSPDDVNSTGGRHHSPLAAALHNRHFRVAQLLCQHGADIELASYNNRTLLIGGHFDAVEWLLKLKHDANVNPQQSNARTSSREADGVLQGLSGTVGAPTDHGGSSLHLASAHDHFEIMRLLIQQGADVDARDTGGSTPLHLASRWGSAESVRFLIVNGATVDVQDEDGSTPLHLASSMGKVKSMQLLIEKRADVDARNKENATPLHLVFTDGQGTNGLDFMRGARAEAVDVLIQHGADVSAHDANGSTPLHLASSWGKFESMQLLIQRGANVNAPNKKKSTPLHLALLTDNPDTAGILWDAKAKAVEVLIQHKADVNALDENGSTPLHLASSAGRTESMELLMQHNVDVKARNKDGSTPLHLASSAWILEPVSLLIKHGANVNEEDKNKLTPLHLAAATSGTECVRLLIQHGANVDARDENNSTPLHWVSSRRRHGAEIVSLLLKHGATADAKDDEGRTPYDIASSTSGRISPEVKRLILNHLNCSKERTVCGPGNVVL